ncbi:hypothetical protein LJE86_01605 [bacterium BMS3Abin03]|jgi:hypothetical protein|nr:hypothetical protein [bacterium BMS3Abin03]MCG6959540.1 hypothetical protein [bacterium BMS3Abin03]
MKKVIVWFILVSFMNLTGCYSHDLLAPSSYKFDERKEIKIITRDTTYNFKGYQYVLVSDTLIGIQGNVLLNKADIDESSVKVPVDEMLLVEVSSVNGGKTTLLVVGSLVVILLIAAVVDLTKILSSLWHL